MYRNCARVLRTTTTPLTKKCLTQQQQQPARTFILHRGRSPWNHIENTMRTVERQFDRMEQDMLRNFGLCRYGGGGGLLRIPIESELFSEGSPSKYSLNINLGSYCSNPENVKLTLKDFELTVETKLESDDGTSRIYQEVSRKFTLPDNIDTNQIKSVLTDGILRIDAPLLSKTTTETTSTKTNNTEIPINRHQVEAEEPLTKNMENSK